VVSDDASLEGRVSSSLLAHLPPHWGPRAAGALDANGVHELVRCLVDERSSDTTLGTALPGLFDRGGDAIPADSLSVRARHALQRLGVTTWGDLARIPPRRIKDLRSVGIRTLAEVVEAAVLRALAEPRSPSTWNPITEGDPHPRATSPADNEGADGPASTDPITEALAKLGAWAEREAVADTLDDLLRVLTSGADVPHDIAEAWSKMAGSQVSAVARHPAADESLEALCDQLLGALGNRPRRILVARTLAPRPLTLQELAADLGITRERVRQIQGTAEARLAELIEEERFAPLRWRVHKLRSLLDPILPANSKALSEAMGEAPTSDGRGPQSVLSRLLLRLAGYAEREGWMLRDGASMVGAEALEDAADEDGLIDIGRVRELLRAAGVASRDHEALLTHTEGFRRFGDRVAIWKGSVADKVVRILAILGRAATPEELAQLIGEGHAERSLRNRLYDDRRLMRVSKNTWALRAWEMEEYTGIADEIAEEIARRDGRASLSDLVEVLTSRFGIAEASVRAYSQTPRFVIENGTVRMRRNDERYDVALASIGDAKGCFRDSPTSVTFCVGVDAEVLRGSGQSLPSAVAAFVGLTPGGEYHFKVEANEEDEAVTVLTWPIDSVVGPTLGSIRLLAARSGAEEGDLLRLRFDRTGHTVSAARVISSVLTRASDLERLSLITGLQLDRVNAIDRLAESLGVEAESVRRVLHARGDSDLVALLPQPASNADLDAALAELEDALLREE